MPNDTRPRLTSADYLQAAQRLNVSVAAIRAVVAVESSGTGFDAKGRCVIRFEPHRFSITTKRAYDKSHPTLSFQPWRPGYPLSLNHSWQLFSEAAALNPNAAVLSTSWGLFQVLGSNYAACGCSTLGEFVKRMEESEAQQLLMFCELIEDWGLDDELRNRQWAAYARIYNGKQFAVNQYDSRLAQAYARFGGK